MKNTKIWLAITGVLLVILGILCIVYPTATLFTLAWMIGLFTLCTGISKFIFAIQTRNILPNSGVRILSGVLQILIGILFLCNTFFVGLSLVIVFAMWVLFESVLVAVQSFDYKKAGFEGWWLMLILGIAGVVLGIIGLRNPVVSADAISLLIGFAVISIGAAHLFGYFGIKKFEKSMEKHVEEPQKV